MGEIDANLLVIPSFDLTIADLGWVIMNYVNKYFASSATALVKDALEYISLICINTNTRSEADLERIKRCHEQVKELIIRSKQFDFLLGSMDLHGNIKVFFLPVCFASRCSRVTWRQNFYRYLLWRINNSWLIW